MIDYRLISIEFFSAKTIGETINRLEVIDIKFSHKKTQNETGRLNMWAGGLNRPKQVSLTGRQFDWQTVWLTLPKKFPTYPLIGLIKIRKILKSQSRKCHHHGRGHFSVHRDQFLTNSDTWGLDPRLRHRISLFARVTSDIRCQKIRLRQESRD